MKISFREQPSTGKCALCGAPMVERTVKRGRNAGTTFSGCSRFPVCTHIVDNRGDDERDDEHEMFPYRDDWGW